LRALAVGICRELASLPPLGRSTLISTAIPARSLRVLLAETRRICTFETSVFMDAAIASRKPSLTVSENSATVIGRPRVIFMIGEFTFASLSSSGDGVVEGMVLEVVAACVVRRIVGAGVDLNIVNAGVVVQVICEEGKTAGAVGSGAVEVVVVSGAVDEVVSSVVVEDVVCSGVVDVVGSGVVEDVVCSGVVEDVVGSGVSETSAPQTPYASNTSPENGKPSQPRQLESSPPHTPHASIGVQLPLASLPHLPQLSHPLPSPHHVPQTSKPALSTPLINF
jgi:hypothetical protein